MTTAHEDIDLHIHSNHSDGALTPYQLLERASIQKLAHVALADHDTVSGIQEAKQAGTHFNIAVIPAVELSVQYLGWNDVHLLGYGVDYTDTVFLKRLAEFRERRHKRNEEILERVNRRLARQGRKAIPLTAVLAFAGGAVGRPHIARALIEQGYAENVEQAFQTYLVPCNVPKQYWSMDDAIREIQRCRGVAVLAHPTSITHDRNILTDIIRNLASLGLAGIEVYNNMASTDEMAFLVDLAATLGLLVTGGSDFHGIEDGIEIGRGRDGIRFSGSLLAPLMERIAQRNC